MEQMAKFQFRCLTKEKENGIAQITDCSRHHNRHLGQKHALYYDYENQLTGFSKNNAKVQNNTYDGDGRRRKKVRWKNPRKFSLIPSFCCDARVTILKGVPPRGRGRYLLPVPRRDQNYKETAEAHRNCIRSKLKRIQELQDSSYAPFRIYPLSNSVRTKQEDQRA